MLLEGFTDRSAEAICIFAYCDGPQAEPRLFEGRTKVRKDITLHDHITTDPLGTDREWARGSGFW